MKGKNDYQLYREPVPSEYSLNEIISRSLLLAAGGDDGHGKQLPAEGGFIYNFTDNRYPPVTEKDGGKIGIYCDPSFDCENINQPALEPDVLSRISRPDEWLPPFLKDVFTFIPVKDSAPHGRGRRRHCPPLWGYTARRSPPRGIIT